MPTILVLSGDDVRALLPMGDCIDVVAKSLRSLARDEVVLPLRTIMHLEATPETAPPGFLGTMPAALAEPPVCGVKVVTVFPGNHALGLDSHLGMVQLFDAATGMPIALLDASSITAIRTAAASGVATEVLARPDARCLALLGTGVQADTHLDAMCAVRPIGHVKVWGHSDGSAQRFVDRQSANGGTAPAGITFEVCDTPQQAVDGADIVCTVTSAKEPILEGSWLRPGTHVNAVGACAPQAREVDALAMARALVFTDCRESAENEAGDLLLAQAEGVIEADHLRGEIGDVLIGRLAGRAHDDEITLYESLGIGIFDLAAGHLVYVRARAQGRGVEAPI